MSRKVDILSVDRVTQYPAKRQDSLPQTSNRGFGRLARSLLRHRKIVGLFWLTVAVVGIALVGPIAGRLTSTTAFPGLPSYEAGLAVMHTYDNGGNISPTVVVVTLPANVRAERQGSYRTSSNLRHFERRTLSARRVLPGGKRSASCVAERPGRTRTRLRRQ